MNIEINKCVAWVIIVCKIYKRIWIKNSSSDTYKANKIASLIQSRDSIDFTYNWWWIFNLKPVVHCTFLNTPGYEMIYLCIWKLK
jgi:hypothetical protein